MTTGRNESPFALEKTFQFDGFKDAIDWMQSCSADIDRLAHHPERTNIYNRIHIVLKTHDDGDIVTDKDYRLAQLLDDHYDIFINQHIK